MATWREVFDGTEACRIATLAEPKGSMMGSEEFKDIAATRGHDTSEESRLRAEVVRLRAAIQYASGTLVQHSRFEIPPIVIRDVVEHLDAATR